MVHQTVDIARWIEIFPLAAHREALDRQAAPAFWYYAPSDVFSPKDLALIEQMRAELGGPSAMGPSVPSDLLLPALGEPPRRDVSKVGGLPYLPQGAWPLGRDGRPLSFIAQLCLADSRDVLTGFSRDDLPQDVLLIFQEGDEYPWGGNLGFGSRLQFEWQPLGIPEATLVGPEDVPEQLVCWRPVYFERYRTTEHARLPTASEEAADRMGLSGWYAATKIGGIPEWQQSEDEAEGLGRYFASLHSINPTGIEHPFPNVPISPWGDWPHDEGFLMLGDVGTLYLFVAGHGRVKWLTQGS